MKRRQEENDTRAQLLAAGRHPGTRLILALLAAGLTACAGAPETHKPPPGEPADPVPAGDSAIAAPGTARAGAATERESAGTIETAPTKPGGERVFFSMTEQGILPVHSTPAAGASVVERPEDRLTFLAKLPEDQLVAELASRYAREWTLLSGGIGSPAAEHFDPRLEEAARRLVVLGLLRTGRTAAEAEPLGEALAFAMAPERSAEQRLIAAAYLEGAGRTDEARALLERLWPVGSDAREEETPPAQARFAVEGLAFATSIEGPGIYTPAPASQIAQGSMVLVYGEFRGFRSVPQESPDGSSYARAFSASLRLFSPTGAEVDRLDFLPEPRGRQLAREAVETVNFWARYRIPAHLEPGKYRLAVEARDVLGGASASGEMELDL